jgi:phenylacetate-CoA ligase
VRPWTRLASGLLFPLHEALKGHRSVAMHRELERTQWLSPDEVDAVQAANLKAFLTRIGRAVPYYRHVFQQAGFDPSAVRGRDALTALPFLTKSLIRQHNDALKAEDAGKLKRYNTGGSTGEPLVFYMGIDRISHDVAAKWRATRWWGVDIGDPEIVLWGSPIELGSQDRVKQVRDVLFRTRLLPAFEMSDAKMDAFCATIARVRPRMLFGYPSALSLLAAHARRRGLEFPRSRVQVSFTTGETLYPADRDAIASVFGAPVANGYGSRDAGFLAHACPAGSLHVTAEHVVMELVDDVGRPVPDGQPGEIVVTHLGTGDFPFVRYRTGDVAVRATDRCSCGRGLPTLQSVMGRSTDFIRTRAGVAMHALALIYEVRDDPDVRAFKFVQEADLSIDLQVVPGPGLTAEREQGIVQRLARRLGPETPLRLRRVDAIPPEKSGKYRYVVSRAPAQSP